MQEEAIMMLWIKHIESKHTLLSCQCHEEGSPTLKDVMVFLTGCDSVPPLGWDCPASIEFTDDVGLPEISTCTLTFYF